MAASVIVPVMPQVSMTTPFAVYPTPATQWPLFGSDLPAMSQVKPEAFGIGLIHLSGNSIPKYKFSKSHKAVRTSTASVAFTVIQPAILCAPVGSVVFGGNAPLFSQ